LARRHGLLGYRKIAEMLRSTAGWIVNDKRVERIWRREGLTVPAKQSKQGRIWFADGSCIRLRAERPNHLWSYDFVEDRTHDGRKYRMLNLIDEFTHECLAIRVDRKLKSADVINVLSDQLRAAYPNISDPTMDQSSSPRRCGIVSEPLGSRRPTLSGAVPGRMASLRASTPGFATNCLMERSSTRLAEAKIVIESWRRHYNTERPHGSLGYKPQRLKCSSPPSPRGRLCNPDQRCRPR
jgi:putative transposase